MAEQEDLLVDRNEYLSAGAHIGMKQRTASMKQFIFKIRSDGLAVLDLKKLDDRIRIAAKFLSRSKKILAVSRRGIGINGVKKFAELTGAKSLTGRFYPGTLTNPAYKEFFEPDVIMIIDPLIDAQVMTEALNQRIPIIALCDTFNETKNIDLVIPINNKGKRSVALALWLLTREVLKESGAIKSNEEFTAKIEEFEGTETYMDRGEEDKKKNKKRRFKR